MRESKLPVAQLELEFNKPSTKSRFGVRNCIWQKYSHGTVVPSSGGGGKRRNLVDEVNARYAGTAATFYSPLWLLCGDEPVGMDILKTVYGGLDDHLRPLFIRNAGAHFWRQASDNLLLPFDLIHIPGHDALIALMGLVREAETVQDALSYDAASQAVLNRLIDTDCDERLLGPKSRNALATRIRSWRKTFGFE